MAALFSDQFSFLVANILTFFFLRGEKTERTSNIIRNDYSSYAYYVLQ